MSQLLGAKLIFKNMVASYIKKQNVFFFFLNNVLQCVTNGYIGIRHMVTSREKSPNGYLIGINPRSQHSFVAIFSANK